MILNIDELAKMLEIQVIKDNSRRITGFRQERGVMIVRNLPYNPVVIEAMVAGMPVVEFSEGVVSNAIKEIWASIG